MNIKNHQVIGYGLGSFGKDLALGVIGSYLLIFYTDVFGISAAAAGGILFITKIWDAINDPMMGSIADRGKVTKWGKYRPYIFIIPIPLAVFSALCFLSPDLSYAGKVIYAALTYTITGMLFTAYDVPLWAMVPTLTKDMNTRNKLIASARIFTTIAMLIASAAAMPAIQAIGGGSEAINLKKGYPIFMAMIGAAGVVFAWITFFSTKEIHNESSKNVSNGNVFREFFSIMNKPLIVVLLTMVFNAIGMILPGVSGVYYMIYYLHRPDMIALYMVIAMGAGLFTSMLAPMLMKVVSAKKLTMIAFCLSAVANAIVYFVGAKSLPVLFFLFACTGLATGTMMVTITSLLTDISDYVGTVKQKRSDGAIFSMNSFAIKLGQALASIVVSMLLAGTGYVANEMVQTESAMTGILLTRSLLPATVAILGAITISQYKLPQKGEENVRNK